MVTRDSHIDIHSPTADTHGQGNMNICSRPFSLLYYMLTISDKIVIRGRKKQHSFFHPMQWECHWGISWCDFPVPIILPAPPCVCECEVFSPCVLLHMCMYMWMCLWPCGSKWWWRDVSFFPLLNSPDDVISVFYQVCVVLGGAEQCRQSGGRHGNKVSCCGWEYNIGAKWRLKWN